MEIIVAATRSNDPEVHAPGCSDVKRGLKTGKYQDATTIEVKEVEDGARWFWSDFLPGGCAHGETEDGYMQDSDAQGYTTYLPCTDKLKNYAETSQEPFTSGDEASKVLSIGESNTTPNEASTMSTITETTIPAPTTEDAKHIKSLQAPSRHERLAAHLVNHHQVQPVDLDDHASLLALHIAAHTPQPVTPEPTPEPAEPVAAIPATNGDAPAKADAKASKREAKQALARLVVEAIDAALRGLTMENESHQAILTAMTADQAARTTAQWIHHLPTGGVWPAEVLPKPDRSDWR
jgi:hypothetical protein